MPRMSEADGFIESIELRLVNSAIDLPYSLAKFHRDNFSPDLIRTHAIDFPEQIRKSVPKRQAEFIAGRLCAQSILSRYSYCHYPIRTGKWREPIWPEPLVGSISHNTGYAAAIAAPKARFGGIGIDIETVVAGSTRDALIHSVVSAKEMGYLNSAAFSRSLDCLLTLVFSAKESFFKAAFGKVNSYFGFDAVEILDVDEEARTLLLRSMHTLCEEIVAGHRYCAHYEFLDSRTVLTVVVLSSM